LLAPFERELVVDTAYLAMLGHPISFRLFASGRQADVFEEALGEATYYHFVRLLQGLGPIMYEAYFDDGN